jgi:predicted DNA-binding transcriptional regulator AlpA
MSVWLPTNEAAKLAGVSPSTLYRAIDSGGVLARLDGPRQRLMFCVKSVREWAQARRRAK